MDPDTPLNVEEIQRIPQKWIAGRSSKLPLGGLAVILTLDLLSPFPCLLREIQFYDAINWHLWLTSTDITWWVTGLIVKVPFQITQVDDGWFLRFLWWRFLVQYISPCFRKAVRNELELRCGQVRPSQDRCIHHTPSNRGKNAIFKEAIIFPKCL